jgi:hypothetical protein
MNKFVCSECGTKYSSPETTPPPGIKWSDGDGLALFIIDYGMQNNTIWVVAIKSNGAIKHYDSNQITLYSNNTINFNVSC